MKKFIKKAIKKAPKLGKDQLIELVSDVLFEYEQLETVLNSIPLGTLVTDNKDRIIYLNKSAFSKIPFRTSELLEKNIFDVIDNVKILNFLKNIFGSGDKTNLECTVQLENKTMVLNINVVPLVESGKIEGNIVLVEDITEQKEIDLQLKRAEKLASLTTLTASVAHEIKNPLGSISIHIQLIQKLMKDKLDDKKTKKINEFLLIVNDEIDRLNTIIVDFLFAVRPMDLNFEEINVNQLLEDLIEFLQFECQKHSISCSFDREGKMPVINVDIKYLKQTVLNIVKNAIAAMPHGGNLTVKTYCKQNRVFIEFVDTGIGIMKEDLEKIFEPYYTTKDNGSGLGLTVVYKLLKEMKGDIKINSELGRGTQVAISFPIVSDGKVLLEYVAGLEKEEK